MKLKSCPFCKSPNTQLTYTIMPDKMKLHYVMCGGCGAVSSFTLNESKESTIEMYNKRSDER